MVDVDGERIPAFVLSLITSAVVILTTILYYVFRHCDKQCVQGSICVYSLPLIYALLPFIQLEYIGHGYSDRQFKKPAASVCCVLEQDT